MLKTACLWGGSILHLRLLSYIWLLSSCLQNIYSKWSTNLLLQVKIWWISYFCMHSQYPLHLTLHCLITKIILLICTTFEIPGVGIFAHLMSVPLSLSSTNIARFWVSRSSVDKGIALLFLHWVSVLTCREHKTLSSRANNFFTTLLQNPKDKLICYISDFLATELVTHVLLTYRNIFWNIKLFW
jgi:hypothetical protein